MVRLHLGTTSLFRSCNILGCFCMLQMGIKDLSELQGELESLKEENEQMEDKLVMEHGLSREKVC